MSRTTTVHIDLAAISENSHTLRAPLAAHRFMAVVKADAYGHGAVRVAQHIEPMVDALAVAFTEEAVALREAEVSAPILILEGPHTASDLASAGKLDFWPVIHSDEQLEWCKTLGAELSQAWIKLDTGMHRLGFAVERYAGIRDTLLSYGISEVTAMSHLASAEEPDDALTRAQLRSWEDTIRGGQDTSSLHNSAATQHALSAPSDWVRVGYALYGGQIKGLPNPAPLRSAMRLSSSVIALRDVPTGESVGYGGRWTAQRDSVIATLPVGYGDGYPWGAADGTPVGINGQIAPLAGRVSMDMVTVDVTDCSNVTLGSPAVLWGDQPAIDGVAAHSGTIGYELMTRLTPRATRVYHK
jgi:alanine racemase